MDHTEFIPDEVDSKCSSSSAWLYEYTSLLLEQAADMINNSNQVGFSSWNACRERERNRTLFILEHC